MNQTKIFLTLALLMVLCGVFTPNTEASVILLSDNFDAENGGVGQVNYANFTNWNVTQGAVDLIGIGFFDFLPGNGLYVDLDGSRGLAGKLVSKTAFDLQPGDYWLSFDLAGSQRKQLGDINTVNVSLGMFIDEDFTLGPNDPFQTIMRSFAVGSATNANLEFEHNGGDNVGLLLDDVLLERHTNGQTIIPEPSTLFLLGTGMIGFWAKRRKVF